LDIIAEGFGSFTEYLSWRSDQRHAEQYANGGKLTPLPTPKQIAERAAEVRSKWTAHENRTRRPDLVNRQPVTVPRASTADLQNLADIG
jgi:hypothetical protein